MFTELLALLFLATIVAYATLAFAALRWRHVGSLAADWLSLYATSAGLWSLLLWGQAIGWMGALPFDFAAYLPLYAALVLAGVLFHYGRAFMRAEGSVWRWWAFLAVWLVVALILDQNPFGVPPEIITIARVVIPREGGMQLMLTLGWGVLMIALIVLALRAYRRTMQPLHRNRLSYLVPILILNVLGNVFLFYNRPAVGMNVLLLSTGVAAYATLNHKLPDIRRATQELFSFFITVTLLGALFFVASTWVAALLRTAPPFAINLVDMGVALVLAVLFTPLLKQVQLRMGRRIFDDPSAVVREYSISISNILDVYQLARVSLGIIRDALGARYGSLFLVDRKSEEELRGYTLRNVGGLNDDTATNGWLMEDSPVAGHLSRSLRSLTHYDIDLLPLFDGLEDAERGWLANLAMDVYVPIYYKGNWIGLFALGPKASSDPYFDDELTLLSTLADQTTVALENARLVDNLVSLNRALDQANQQLENLDRAKSDFIAVLSHELRTPMGVLLGYSQLLAADPDFMSKADHQPIVDGLNKGATRLQELIEVMIDMATIDNRVLRLYHKPVPLSPIVQAAADKFDEALADRRLTLTVDDSLFRLPMIEADSESLVKVFYHLIINAIKYTPDGGQITVRGGRFEPDDKLFPFGGVELVVSDTGIGIDPQHHELIFAKFYSTGDTALHSTGKTKFKGGGPGLGLAIARGIVEAHGGKIWVESTGYDEEKMSGSQFHVALPIRSNNGNTSNGAENLASVTGPLKLAPVQ
ncbi:MAG: ATP-binding protein [Anaerolineales bacterium]